MKTQLLEDIGQNATLPLAPSKTAGNLKANDEVHKLAPVENTEPASPRSAPGVWRQKPAAVPLLSTTEQPEQQPTPLQLDDVFEEIAALEAQLVPESRQDKPAIAPVEPRHASSPAPAEPPRKPAVPPAAATLAPDSEIAALEAQLLPSNRQQAPAIAPVEPPHEPPPAPAEPVRKPAVSPAAATLASHSTQSSAAPHDPLFDLTPWSAPQTTDPFTAPQTADPFTRAPTGMTPSRKRYLLWAACVMSCALLVYGGRWLYEERSDAGARALVAGEAKRQSQVDAAVQPRAIAANELKPEPAGDVRPTPAVPASDPVPTPPPLVMLEPEPVAEQAPVAPLPKPSIRRVGEQSGAAARPVTKRSEREPVRQFARASTTDTKKPSGQESATAATLKACREHGYDAAQCIRRACSMTKYGFVCRGR